MARIVGFAGGAFVNVDQGGAAVDPSFVGPLIGDMTLLEDVAMVERDFSGHFSDDGALTFSAVGALPAGLSLSSAGVLSGTPTDVEVASDIVIRADDGTHTIDSNAFTIRIVAAFGSGLNVILMRRRGRR